MGQLKDVFTLFFQRGKNTLNVLLPNTPLTCRPSCPLPLACCHSGKDASLPTCSPLPILWALPIPLTLETLLWIICTTCHMQCTLSEDQIVTHACFKAFRDISEDSASRLCLGIYQAFCPKACPSFQPHSLPHHLLCPHRSRSSFLKMQQLLPFRTSIHTVLFFLPSHPIPVP